jgi:hypothetical protein
LRRAEGGAKIVGVFRVKNHDFTPKNLIFSNFRGARPLDPPLGTLDCVVDMIYNGRKLDCPFVNLKQSVIMYSPSLMI